MYISYIYTYLYIYICICFYIYILVCICICAQNIHIYIYILKTLRATAVSKGDGMMFEKGGNQGIGRNH